MTEQDWMDNLSPTERCNPHAKRQHRAIYQGWIRTVQSPTAQAETPIGHPGIEDAAT